MRGMDLDDAEAGVEGALCGRAIVGDDLGDARDVQRLRLRIDVVEGERRWRDHRPAAGFQRHSTIAAPRREGAGLAPGMRQLHRRDRALRRDETRDARPCLRLRVVPDAGILRRDAGFRGDRAGLGEHHRGATDRATAEMHQVPIVRHAVDRGVLAHRRDHDAVAQRQVALAEWL